MILRVPGAEWRLVELNGVLWLLSSAIKGQHLWFFVAQQIDDKNDYMGSVPKGVAPVSVIVGSVSGSVVLTLGVCVGPTRECWGCVVCKIDVENRVPVAR